MRFYIAIFITVALLSLLFFTVKDQAHPSAQPIALEVPPENQHQPVAVSPTAANTDPSNDYLARRTNLLTQPLVTNSYNISSNQTVVEIIEYPPVYKLLGTRRFEELARNHYDKLIETEPNLAELKEIFEDLPASKNSSLIFSGIYLVHALKSEILDQARSEFDNRLDLERALQETLDITDIQERERRVEFIKSTSDAQLFMIHQRVNNSTRLTKDLLVGLYGEMPKSIFQRLMSIETMYGPERLPYP